MQLSIFSSEELPANRSLSQDCERDWQTRVETLPSCTLPSLHDIAPHGWYGRTSPAFYPTLETLSATSSQDYQNSGMGGPTGFLTLNTSEWNHTLAPSLNDAGVCSLSDILEIGDVPPRYFLSAKACAGILRRAEKRGKELPQQLRHALTQAARVGGPTSCAAAA